MKVQALSAWTHSKEQQQEQVLLVSLCPVLKSTRPAGHPALPEGGLAAAARKGTQPSSFTCKDL